jgi:hypothetical protein
MMAPQREKLANIVSFINDGTACVVFLPFANELTERQKKRIDAARVIRFFVHLEIDEPLPPRFAGPSALNAYSVKSLGWAVGRSTYVHSEILPDLPPVSAPQILIKALLEADALAGTEVHRGVVTIVAPRPFTGCQDAICRPSPTPPHNHGAAR